MSKVIRQLILEAIKKFYPKQADIDFSVDYAPANIKADFSSNIALVLAKKIGKKPMEVAEQIRNVIASGAKQSQGKKIALSPLDKLDAPRNDGLAVTVAPPGFLNFKLSPEVWQKELQKILEQGTIYGSSSINKGKKARVEYVSANPTGPIHIGNARGGPYGETICKVLESQGWEVLREYFHNDIGGQVERMGETIWYWYQKLQGKEFVFPEGGYQGEYLKEIAESAIQKFGRNLKDKDKTKLTKFALNAIFRENLETLKRLGIEFDLIVKESELQKSGKTAKAIEEIKNRGLVHENEGALWFVLPSLNPPLNKGGKEGGADREAVVVKSNGVTTYFASDIAYHKEKFQSGYDLVIDILGSNHHGHVPKLLALTEIFDFGPADFKVLLYQYVRVKQGKEVVRMSKRTGTYVTAKEVLDEVGPASMIFLLLLTAINTHVDFDLQLAKDTSEKNPVFRVQYGHARICSIFKKAKIRNSQSEIQSLSLLSNAEELGLIRELVKFPELIEEISKSYNVHYLPHYLLGLADRFHSFYEKVRVISEDKEKTLSRLALVKAVQTVLANGLKLMGIAPLEEM